MTERFTLTVDAAAAGTRIDQFIARQIPELSRAAAQHLLRQGHIVVNGSPVKSAHHLAPGDVIAGQIVRGASFSAEAEDIPLDIMFQDSDLVVINKPPGLVVHPAPGHRTGTLANGLAAHFPQTAAVGAAERPGIVHRLDKDTSGLMVVALTPAAHASLQAQIASRAAGRQYLALAAGHLKSPAATIDAPVGRDPHDRTRMAVFGAAQRSASTSYTVLECLSGFDLIEATLHTGRTHQIRVHLASAGHPLAGDLIYGGPDVPGLSRQFLHAHRLRVYSPSTGKEMIFSAPLAADLVAVLDRLR